MLHYFIFFIQIFLLYLVIFKVLLFDFILFLWRAFFLILWKIKIKSKIIFFRLVLIKRSPWCVLTIFIDLASLNFLILLSKNEFLIIQIFKLQILLYLCPKHFFIFIILEIKWILFLHFLFFLFFIKLIFIRLFTLFIFNMLFLKF